MNILELNNVSKHINKKKILDNISFNIEEGEIVGFVGPNGAGKTTTIRLISNLLFPDNGYIKIGGYDLKNEREKALSCMSGIIENPSLYTFLTGRDNIEFVRKINNLSKDKMEEIIHFIGLPGRINDKVRKYSLGMKQRLALGICLLKEPKLLVLDEPTNGLDPSGTIELRDMLISKSKKENMSVLISSHILSEVEKICDKIIYIKNGSIVSINNNIKNSNEQIIKIIFNNSEYASQFLSINEFVKDFSITEKIFCIRIDKSNFNNLLKSLLFNNIDFNIMEMKENYLESEYSKIYGEVIL